MMRRLAKPYAIVGWLAAVVGAVGGVALRIIDPVPVIPDELGVGNVSLVGFGFLGVTFASVGALLVVRRPENTVGWWMVVIGGSNALAVMTAAVAFSLRGTTMCDGRPERPSTKGLPSVTRPSSSS